MMSQSKTNNPPAYPKPASVGPEMKSISAFFPRDPLDGNQPVLIFFSTTPLFRIEKCPEKYAHLLKKKDLINIGPIVNYLINNSGHVAFLAGDVVKNLYLSGKRKYKTINILAIVTGNSSTSRPRPRSPTGSRRRAAESSRSTTSAAAPSTFRSWRSATACSR